MNSQFSPFLRQLLPILLLSQLLYSCGLFDDPTTSSVSCESDCNVTITEKPEPQPATVEVSGKLAQSYVKNASVWADQLVDGEGDLQRSSDEPIVLSGENGDYQLPGIAGEFRLVTSGGFKQDSAGKWIGASPMVAPAPEPGQATTNVTPLTTLVAFEPALKEKLAAYGDWNADIASPSGVSGNLLRIAKTVETFSSALSGGDSPVVSDFSTNLKSLGKLATSLNSVSGDLASEAVLKTSTSSAITAVVSDPALVPNPPTEAQRAALISSVEQAVQGIAAAIPATDDEVVEDPTLLAQIEEVLDNASIDETVAVTVTMGGGLQFAPVIRKITLNLEDDNTTLTLSADVSDDDLSSLSYDWSTDPTTLALTDPNQPTTQILGFEDSAARISLLVTDSVNSVDIAACTWQANPTTCNCLDGECN